MGLTERHFEQITVEREEAVGRITLNRPNRLNALTSRMSDELVEAFGALGDDEQVRAVVLTGAGRGFCAGHDLNERQADYREHLERSYHRLIPVIVKTPKPVIAAVNGVAAGAGVSLAAACDIRIASEEARFIQAFVKIGLVPDSGGTWLLPRLIGSGRALELSMTGDTVDANAALDMGLVSRVVPADVFEKEVSEYAARLAAMPTAALAATKELLREALTLDLEEALHREADAQARMGNTADHLEGVTAFAEKREPKFQGR